MKAKTPAFLTELHWTHSTHCSGACNLDEFRNEWSEIKKFRAPKKKKFRYTWAEITAAVVVVTAMVVAYLLK